MSVDKITPRLFAKGVGKSNEPRNALLLTVLIAEGGILIGELDTIARVCSMFYLAAYGFINLSFFLESWASTDFNPTFKVKRWIGFGRFFGHLCSHVPAGYGRDGRWLFWSLEVFIFGWPGENWRWVLGMCGRACGPRW